MLIRRTFERRQDEHAWPGAHDADRTRDLVLTKDVLCQLSYVGPSTSSRVVRYSQSAFLRHPTLSALREPHLTSSLERAMGFEPTTASLEGWNSTTELRPPFPLLVLSAQR